MQICSFQSVVAVCCCCLSKVDGRHEHKRWSNGLAVSVSSHTNHPCHYKCAVLPLFVLDGILTHCTSTPRNFLIPPPIEKLFFSIGRWEGMPYNRHTLHTACFTHSSLLLSYESPTSPSPSPAKKNPVWNPVYGSAT